MSDEEIGIVKESNNCIYGKGKKKCGMGAGSWGGMVSIKLRVNCY